MDAQAGARSTVGSAVFLLDDVRGVEALTDVTRIAGVTLSGGVAGRSHAARGRVRSACSIAMGAKAKLHGESGAAAVMAPVQAPSAMRAMAATAVQVMGIGQKPATIRMMRAPWWRVGGPVSTPGRRARGRMRSG